MTKFWFTYTQEEYKENRWVRVLTRETEKPKEWTYKDCKVQLVGTKNNKTRVILRRMNSKYSKTRKFEYKVNLMMGFVADKAYEPKEEKIIYKKQTIDAWAIKFDVEELENPKSLIRPITNVKIWIRKEDDPTQTEIKKLFEEINKQTPVTKYFESDVEKNSDILPVIYQPRIDAWRNFLREIHVHPLSIKDYEVTLIFNDEVLRAHGPLDIFYRALRIIIHKRILDVETFCMHFADGHFKFPGIYSDKNTIFADDIHGHKPEKYPNGIPDTPIKYYFDTDNHPIVFINTSNHAMGEGDNNHDFWKWEYTPWTERMAVDIGNKSREEIDDSFRIIKSKHLRKLFFSKKEPKCKKE